jgi:hypothetical protein
MYHQKPLIYLIGEFINILLPLPADLFALLGCVCVLSFSICTHNVFSPLHKFYLTADPSENLTQ